MFTLNDGVKEYYWCGTYNSAMNYSIEIQSITKIKETLIEVNSYWFARKAIILSPSFESVWRPIYSLANETPSFRNRYYTKNVCNFWRGNYNEILQQKQIEATGIKTLKVGFNNVFGYYFEVTNKFKNEDIYNHIPMQQQLTRCFMCLKLVFRFKAD